MQILRTGLILAVLSCGLHAQGLRDDSPYADSWTPLEGVQPAHWRVIWHTEPSTTATISWSTSLPGEDHRVHLGEDRVVEATVHGKYTMDEGEEGPPAYYHHARITDLPPGTRVDFRVETDEAFSPPLHFFTAPANGTGFEFVYGGDSRTGWRDRCRVNLMIAALAEERPELLCFIHGGDYITEGSKSMQWLRWLSHHELTVTGEGRVLPIIPARGNHDWGPNYGQVFDWPGVAAGAWFRTDLGDLSILNLDTNASLLGDQFKWLKKELPLARSDSRWLLANYHRPMFPAVKGPSDAAPHWVPAFEAHDMDLVLESDGHCMKRTAPIRDGKADPTGVTYVGEGGLGVPQRIPDGDRWWFEGGFTRSGHHVTLVSVGDEELTTRFLQLEEPASIAEGSEPVLPAGHSWRYLAGKDPAAEWTQRDFDDAAWPRDPAGFGFGDEDDATVLGDMRREYGRVYLRTTFEWDLERLGERLPALFVDYDDGFIAYLNGVEVARAAVGAGSGSEAVDIASHEAGKPEVFELPLAPQLLQDGENVIAVEGHNRKVNSSDFSLHPWLVALVEGASASEVLRWTVVDQHTLRVRP